MENNSLIALRLQQLGLSNDEASIFMSLVDAPKTLLEVSRATGIHRSTVYRIVDELMQRSIVHEVTTNDGKMIAAANPEALELLVVDQEKIAATRRSTFQQLLPLLKDMQGRDDAFAVRTYKGVAGAKQMLWNELRTKTGILIFTCAPMEVRFGSRWPEKYRAEIIRRGIVQRGIENPGIYTSPLSQLPRHDQHYIRRLIPRDVLSIDHELTIHDDTISLYNSWHDHTQLGTEIKNPFLANFMRQIFEHYWALGSSSVDAGRSRS